MSLRRRWLSVCLTALLVGICGLSALAAPAGVRSLALAGHHTALIDQQGTLWTFGQNNFGQLGNGRKVASDSTPTREPQAVLQNARQVACGFYHTIVVDETGAMYGAGKNKYGAVGNGATDDVATLEWLPIQDVMAVACGDDHNLAIVGAQGELWTWGRNQEGQLGNGKAGKACVLQPTSIGLTNVTAIAAGDYCSAALLNDGTVMTWGGGKSGELGNGKKQNSNKPVPADIMDVVQISCGDRHMAAVTAEGDLHMWGINDYGQLGLPRATEFVTEPTLVLRGVKRVACGDKHTAAVTAKGELYTWGVNEFGQLGNGKAGEGNSRNVTKGRAVCEPKPAVVLTGVEDVFCGYDHTIVLMRDGTLRGFGADIHGQLSIQQWQ